MFVRLVHSSLRERRLAGESIFFDGYSGETHYLDGLAGSIMRRVRDAGAVELEQLHAELTGLESADHGDTTTPTAIRETAAMLQQMGLVRIDDAEH